MHRCSALLMVTFLLPACGPDEVAFGGCETPVSPTAWPAEAPPRFEEVWRAGGTNEGEELSMPYFASAGPDGALAVTDLELQTIGVSAEGGWLGPITQTGDGPGEVAMVVSAAWTDAGNLVLLDMVGGKVLELDPTQRVPAGLVEELPLNPTALAPIMQGGQVMGIGVDPSRNAFFQADEPMGETLELTQRLMRFANDGSVDTVATIVTPSLGGDWLPARTMVAPAVPRLVFSVGRRGQLAIAGGTTAYEISIREPDGSEVNICRSAPGLPLRPDEFGEGVDPENPFVEPAMAAPRPQEPAPIGRLMFGASGRLWVERDRPTVTAPIELQSGRTGSLYDVFDPDGSYVGAVRAPEDARIVAADGNRVWAFETGAFDVVWVVAYQLVEN